MHTCPVYIRGFSVFQEMLCCSPTLTLLLHLCCKVAQATCQLSSSSYIQWTELAQIITMAFYNCCKKACSEKRISHYFHSRSCVELCNQLVTGGMCPSPSISNFYQLLSAKLLLLVSVDIPNTPSTAMFPIDSLSSP